MSTTIKYKNGFGTEITQQQILHLDKYDELVFENAALKKVSTYLNGSLWTSDVFLSANESYLDYLPELSQVEAAVFYSNRSEINDYVIWESRGYGNGTLQAGYSKVVFDSLGRRVASRTFNDNNQPTSGVAKTFHFGGSPIIIDDEEQGYFQEDGHCVFVHDSSGGVFILPHTGGHDEPYYSVASFLAGEEDGPMLSLMSSAEIAYYTSSEPLVPNF